MLRAAKSALGLLLLASAWASAGEVSQNQANQILPIDSTLRTTTNNDAPADRVAYFVSSACAGIAIATGVYSNVCGSLALPAGDWDIDASLDFFANGATYTRVDLEGAVSTSSGDNITGATLGETYRVIDHSSGDTAWNYYGMNMSARKSISTTTTYYLKAYGGATSAGNPKIYGIIKARAAR